VTYFKEMMEKANKPYLIIQLDEHHSDVGYQTRIEAGIDSFRNDFATRTHRPGMASSVAEGRPNFEENVTRDDTIYFPYLSPVLDTLIYSSYAAHGYTAKPLSLDQKIINLGYKYVSGGECLPNVAVAGSVIDKFQKGEFDPKRSVLNLADSCLSCNFHQYASLIKAACRKAGMEDLRIYSPKLGMPRPILPDGLVLDMTASCVLGSLLYKLYFRFHPYEKRAGATQEALDQSLAIIKGALQKKIPLWEIPLQKLGARLGKAYIQKLVDKDLIGEVDAVSEKDIEPEQKSSPAMMDKVKEFLHPSKYMLQAAGEIRALFEGIAIEGERRPRIGLLGDLYVKYNTILNEDIYSLIEELGGEILLPSYMETGAHLMDASVRESNAPKDRLIKLTLYEQSFEHIFRGMLDDSFEPPVEECVALMHEYGLEHFIPGETTINVGRFLYYARHKLVDAVIHVNPILCCPGSVTTSIFRKLQKDFNLPIVNVFYDGINKPNKGIIPQMHNLMNAD
jgi:predicted nucleotide-binding protein (sugar kinase/HSP70/actin superfamily)